MVEAKKVIFMPPPFEEVLPLSVHSFVRPSEIWCLLNNFWKKVSIKFGMLIYNIKTQVKFDFGYNPLIFDGVLYGLL